MRVRRITISIAFAAGLATLPLSAAQAQYYSPYSPFALFWPFCANGRRSRCRHDNHHRAATSAHWGAALLLPVLRTVALLPTAGLLHAGILPAAEFFWATLGAPILAALA